MSNILSEEYWVIKTHGVNGTLVIGATFIFLAYFLHPAVESAYQRVRAYRAWRAIEKRHAVEVTDYPMLAEVFGGRGRWDAARIITALLAVFSLASWGLELSMDLATHEGKADLLNRPPPVELGKNSTGGDVWKVKSREYLDYDGDWLSLPNMFEEEAKSRYNLQNGTKYPGEVNGDIIVAYWYTDPDVTLFYYTGDDAITVVGVNCTEGDNPDDALGVYEGDNDIAWGNVFTCEKGPSLTSDLQTQLEAKSVTPPTIIMTRADGEVFLIVEESSSYPSFMYSIWTVGTDTDTSTVVLEYYFHISATMRLAEAVVTGIVHGETSGGGCFGLLRQHSDKFTSYDNDAERAFPFGECPNGDSSTDIEDKESVEYGLKIGANALLCFVWVMLLTSIGMAWSLCLRSSIGMDVYDRDELIRAVSLHGVAPGCTPPSEIRIFVRREDTGNISVVISDTGRAHGGCAHILRRSDQVVEDVEPSPVAATVDQYNRGFRGADVPVGPRTVWLEGVRTGMGRLWPGPNGDFRYPTSAVLSAPPVPSNAGSLVTTPIHSPTRRGFARPQRPGLAGGIGPSSMFDTEYSPGDSPEETPVGMQAASYGNAIAGARVSGPFRLPLEGERPALAVSQATSASDIELPRLSNRSNGSGSELNISPVSSSGWKTPERRGLTRGRGQLGPLTPDLEEDTDECTSSSENLNMEMKEGSPSSESRPAGDE